MRMSSLLSPGVVLAMLTLGSGCSQSAPPPAQPTAEAKPAAEPARNQELNQAIQQPLDKARGVEAQVLDEAAKKREEIDAQSE
ncbi:MAG: hypothetical protein KDJ14_02340 [Xanthomonadales bacterium]|nr:hypothetical protein [Xanthomonadales bacterium]